MRLCQCATEVSVEGNVGQLALFDELLTEPGAVLAPPGASAGARAAGVGHAAIPAATGISRGQYVENVGEDGIGTVKSQVKRFIFRFRGPAGTPATAKNRGTSTRLS
ncbi:hypothetical protein ACFPC0_36855 [Streptomyces andamanensis]|uniref:Uncharacterized protein n=1 Tax=Streptomyces andamanensis TaxID=1565035 RepID=A0ABV8TS66_9ACTN